MATASRPNPKPRAFPGLWSTVVIVLGLGGLAVAQPGCASEEVCGSGADEDGDGFVDCFDDDCWQGGLCPELCTSIFDEDGDGLIGCLDRDCWVADGACEEVCDSSEDEDGDGAMGCDDSDCWVAGGLCSEVCATENDEDGDGDAGCLDSDCWVAEAGCQERCDGGNDEDADGSTDCDDPDCAYGCEEVGGEVTCSGDLLCAPGYEEDVRPILEEHCLGPTANCHSNMMALGGLSVQRYDDMLLTSIFCPNANKGECALSRIEDGSMPQNCAGCVPATQVDVIRAWLAAGQRP